MGTEQIPVALQLYTLRKEAAQDFYGVLKEVASIGYVGVELAGLYNKPPAEVRKVADDLGLTICSSHVRMPKPETVAEIADTAKTLGYRTVVSGFGKDAWKTLDGVKRVAAEFQHAAKLLEPHGIRLLYHNHWWEMERIGDRVAYDIFMELAPDVLGQLDIYWASNFGALNVPSIVARYSKRLPCLHLKDGPLVQGQPHMAVGAGKVDVRACISAADPKVLEWLIVELDECAGDMMQAVRESYRYLTSNGLARGRK